MATPRKIVQICCMPESVSYHSCLFALSDDGMIFMMDDPDEMRPWVELPSPVATSTPTEE